MSAELIGILSVGVALAALLLTSIKGVREELPERGATLNGPHAARRESHG